jgi:hypothetical protein
LPSLWGPPPPPPAERNPVEPWKGRGFRIMQCRVSLEFKTGGFKCKSRDFPDPDWGGEDERGCV